MRPTSWCRAHAHLAVIDVDRHHVARGQVDGMAGDFQIRREAREARISAELQQVFAGRGEPQARATAARVKLTSRIPVR